VKFLSLSRASSFGGDTLFKWVPGANQFNATTTVIQQQGSSQYDFVQLVGSAGFATQNPLKFAGNLTAFLLATAFSNPQLYSWDGVTFVAANTPFTMRQCNGVRFFQVGGSNYVAIGYVQTSLTVFGHTEIWKWQSDSVI
jgi:hypothetical protein